MNATGQRLRRLWRPAALARIGAPLLVLIVIAMLDKQLLAGRLDDLAPAHLMAAWQNWVHYALVLIGALFAMYAVRSLGHAITNICSDYVGMARAHSLSTFISILLYIVVIVVAINAGINISGLLVGGAVTGVVVGIAGQASLANIIAGLVILFARPYTVGMYVTVRAGSFGGVEYSGQVWEVSLFYTTLHTGGQEIRIPNSAMIGAVVVLRPQETDVYIPITLPRATDIARCLDDIRHGVTHCTAHRRVPRVTLESVTEVGYVVAVRVFVAGDRERDAVERVIARLTRDPGTTDDRLDAAVDRDVAASVDAQDSGTATEGRGKPGARPAAALHTS